MLGTELIEKYGDDYALSRIAQLIPEKYLDFGNEHWQHLAFHIRTGAPLPICDEIELTDLDYTVNKASEEWMQTPAALAMAQALDLGKTRRGLRILEISCGSAVFGATLAHSDPDSTIILVDDQVNLNRAKTTVDSIGLDHRATYIAADSLDQIDEISELKGETFDLVLIANNLHRKTGGECERLFKQLYPLIKPGRELAIVDVFPGQEKGDLHRAIFDLELNLRTARGRLHDPRLLEGSLKESGFDDVQFAHLPTSPFYWGLILAQRS